MAESSWQPVMSAAQRRRQRRLRSWWRHEEQSIAAALATSKHHSALRGQKKARAGEGDFEMHYTSPFRRHPLPQAAGTVYYPMDVDDVPAAGGSRPDRLLDVSGPQERVLRRTVEQNVEPVRGVPVLDAPVPQMVDQAAEVVRFFVSLPVVAEQVIEVPTIILEDPIPQRALLRAPQLAEQLVEVPTTPGYAFAVLAVQTLGWREARALFEQLAARPGRDTNTAGAMVAEACGRLCDHAAPFQQVFVEFVKVPQLQYIDSMVGFPVASQRQGSQCKLCRRRRFARC